MNERSLVVLILGILSRNPKGAAGARIITESEGRLGQNDRTRDLLLNLAAEGWISRREQEDGKRPLYFLTEEGCLAFNSLRG